MTSTGWTLDQVDATPLPDAWELFEFWNEWPPAHVLLRSFTGYKPQNKAPRELETSEVSELSALLGPAQQAPAHVADMVRWAETMKTKIARA